MIDYVTLLLTNMTGGLIVLAAFLVLGLGHAKQRSWTPVFGITGVVATVCGLAMTFTEPIPKPYAMAYGEMSVLLGVLFLGAAWALAAGYDLWPLGFYAFIPGAIAILLGVRIIDLSLTAAPILAGIGFILTGLGGLGAGVTLWKHQARGLRLAGAAVLLAAAAIWAFTAFMAYWMHMQPPKSQQSHLIIPNTHLSAEHDPLAPLETARS
jgi:putative membrane protein